MSRDWWVAIGLVLFYAVLFTVVDWAGRPRQRKEDER